MSQTIAQQAQRLHELHLAATNLAEELGLTFLEIRAIPKPGPAGWDLEIGITTPYGDPFRMWLNADDPGVIHNALTRISNRRNPSS